MILPALFRALLLLRLLLLLLSRIALLTPVLSFLLALVALGLIFLSPLFPAAASSLCVGEVSRSKHRRGYCQRQPDLLQVIHVHSSFQY